MSFMINEAKRSELINKSKQSIKGKERYDKRNKSKVNKSTREMNDIDMNSLFKKGELTIKINVRGETDSYIVTIRFDGFLDEIHKVLKPDMKYDMRLLCQCLTRCFDREDTYIHCSCPDFTYRFNFWATINKFDAGPEQHDNGQWIRNPNDKLGSCCKHGLLVLSNNRWLQTVARVIYNYCLYMEKHNNNLYNKIIYRALYDTEYVKPDSSGDFSMSKDDINKANDERRTSTQFQKGNQSGYKFAKNSETHDDEPIGDNSSPSTKQFDMENDINNQ